MNNYYADLPRDAAARINYISVLASCESYSIPSSPYLNVDEFIRSRFFSWYKDILPISTAEDDIAWYTNYE